jgi:hypothetical protein
LLRRAKRGLNHKYFDPYNAIRCFKPFLPHLPINSLYREEREKIAAKKNDDTGKKLTGRRDRGAVRDQRKKTSKVIEKVHKDTNKTETELGVT